MSLMCVMVSILFTFLFFVLFCFSFFFWGGFVLFCFFVVCLFFLPAKTDSTSKYGIF